jgi:LuxR family maltose regulon positive regulatory protein
LTRGRARAAARARKGSNLQAPLLKTKLRLPSLRPDLLERPQLLERLERGLDRKLTLVSAPAGFGKTTLLSVWAGRSSRPVGWISMEAGDNDPARFLAYCLEALRGICPQFGEGQALKPQLPHRPAREATLIGLINELAELPSPLALVLDDYHLVEEEATHYCLRFLIEHLPPQLHLVVSTRADPPLALSALRARGQLNELRAVDLRFAAGEAKVLLNERLGFRLSPEEADALTARTEGWIAGLQMAAVSLRGHDNPGAFIAEFTGSNRYVLDYLVEEVLERQPRRIQSFLLRSSILERLSGPLCEQVTGQGDAQGTIELLERSGLFVEPLDAERVWYRYHRIFAEILRLRLTRQDPAELPQLHRKAAAWFAAAGFGPEAIAHCLAAGEHEQALSLIERGAEENLMNGEFSRFLGWMNALPQALLGSRPRVCIYHALCLLLLGRPVREVRERLAHAAGAGEQSIVHGELLAFEAIMAFLEGNIHDCVNRARQALEHLGEASLFRALTIRLLDSAAYIESGDIEATIRTVEENLQSSRAAGNLLAAVICQCELAELHAARGELARSRALYEQAWREAQRDGGQALPIGGLARIGLGNLYREWNELQRAEALLREGIELARGFGMIGCLDGYLGLAWVLQALDDSEGACRAMGEAQRLADQFAASDLDNILVTLHVVRLWIAQGRTREAGRWAEHWLQERKSLKPLGSHYMKELDRTTLARVRLAEGRPREALLILEKLRLSAERLARIGTLIEIHALRALGFWLQGQREESLATLEKALRLAQPEGYRRRILDCPAPMPALLREAAARDLAGGYAARLLSALSGQGGAPEPGPGAGQIAEPLSGRELDVLVLLAEGLSNKQVAERLFISLATVKWHTSNIYGKLGVGSRTQAVFRARVLGLIDRD